MVTMKKQAIFRQNHVYPLSDVFFLFNPAIYIECVISRDVFFAHVVPYFKNVGGYRIYGGGCGVARRRRRLHGAAGGLSLVASGTLSSKHNMIDFGIRLNGLGSCIVYLVTMCLTYIIVY